MQTTTLESQSKPGTKMVNPEPCKELERRPQLFLAGTAPYYITFIYPGFDCGSLDQKTWYFAVNLMFLLPVPAVLRAPTIACTKLAHDLDVFTHTAMPLDSSGGCSALAL